MTPSDAGTRQLAALAELRARAREEAERALVAAIADEAIVKRRADDAEAERVASAERVSAGLAEARAVARTGQELVAVESLARAGREEALHRAAQVAEARRLADSASLGVARARSTLARAQADEKAVLGRLASWADETRTAAHRREDDEADERARPR